MVKAVAYARYSTDMQREESIEAQLKCIHEYAEKKDIVIIEEYIDRGISGRRADERESFLRMTKDSRLGNFELVLVHKSNRFARNREESALFKHKLKKNGVKVTAVAQDFGEGSHTVIIEALMEGLDEYYSLELANETMKGLLANADKCKYNGGRVLYGYKVEQDNNYLIEPEESAVVSDIYDRFCNGWSYSEILRYLKESGITNRNGKLFSKSTIYEMLRNEKYKGIYLFNKIPRRNASGKRNNRIKNPDDKIVRIEGGMPQIVGNEKWQKAQDILDNRKKEYTPIPRKRNYILTGFIKCAKCGSSYVGYSTKKGYYACTRKKNKYDCDNKNIPKEQTEESVISRIQEMIESVSVESFVTELKEYYIKHHTTVEEEKKRISGEINSLNRKIDNMLDMIAEGLASKVVKERLNEYAALKHNLESRLSMIKVSMPPINQETISLLLDGLKPQHKDMETIRTILNKLHVNIVVHPDGYEMTLRLKKSGESEHNVRVPSPTPALCSLFLEMLQEL